MKRCFFSLVIFFSLFYLGKVCSAEEHVYKKSTSTYFGPGAISDFNNIAGQIATGVRTEYQLSDKPVWFILGVEQTQYMLDVTNSERLVSANSGDAMTLYGGVKYRFKDKEEGKLLPYASLGFGTVKYGSTAVDIDLNIDGIPDFSKLVSGGVHFSLMGAVGVDYPINGRFLMFTEVAFRYGIRSNIFSLDEFGEPNLKTTMAEFPIYFGISYLF